MVKSSSILTSVLLASGLWASQAFAGAAIFSLFSVTPAAEEEPVLVPIPNEVTAPLRFSQLASGFGHTCALSEGRVKCWGANITGALGLGGTSYRGGHWLDMGNNLPFVDLGPEFHAVGIDAGTAHTCALSDLGRIKCWGNNTEGQLGLGDWSNRGVAPGDMGANLPYVDLGDGVTARGIAAGGSHTCALLDNGKIACWGRNFNGQLGNESYDTIGDGPFEMGDALTYVALGEGLSAVSVHAGGSTTCAVLSDGGLKCWGSNLSGQLGIGNLLDRGGMPGSMGDALPYANVGAHHVITASVGDTSVCALLAGQRLKCWGGNGSGRLGLGDTRDRGAAPEELGSELPPVDLGTGFVPTSFDVNGTACAVGNGRVKCWGENARGQLGVGDTFARGDDPGEMGDALPLVDLGTEPDGTFLTVALSVGEDFVCALSFAGRVKCWGNNPWGQLGLGHTDSRGDQAGLMGNALPYLDLGTTVLPGL